MAAPFKARTISNPSAQNVYFDVSGSAISSSNQPEDIAGSIRGVQTSSITDSQLRGSVNGTNHYLDFSVVAYSGSGAQVAKIRSAVDLPYFSPGEYVIKSFSTTLGGVASDSVKFPGNFIADRSIDKVESVRTYKIATALRENYWSEVSGIFTTAVPTSSDLSTMGSDRVGNFSRSDVGAVYFFLGAGTGVNTNYDLPT